MTQRGRKSAAELAIIGLGGLETRRRLDAPADLSTEQAKVWRGVVNSLPADWFSPGSAPVLAALCRHVVAGRRVAGWIARLEEAQDGLDEERWFKLLARQEAESKMVAALATRLRLTPQSRYTPHGAAVAGRKDHDGPRPWEM
jgi:hypothetical protein